VPNIADSTAKPPGPRPWGEPPKNAGQQAGGLPPSGITRSLGQTAKECGPTGRPATAKRNYPIPRANRQRMRGLMVAAWRGRRLAHITRLVESGADVRTVEELARHSDPRITMAIYAAAGEKRLADLGERRGSLATIKRSGMAVK